MKKIGFAFTFLLLITGCSSYNEETLQCNEVEYIREFPKEISLENVDPLPLDLAGCTEVYGIDSLLVCRIPEGEYLWKVYSLRDYQLLGQLLGKGHGHDEFVESCIPDQSFRTDTALFCEFWSSANGTWYRCNLTQSLHSGHIVWDRKKQFKDSDLIHTNMCLNDSLFFMVKYNGYAGYIRSLWVDGTVKDMDHVGNLNQLCAEEDINTLAAVRALNQERMMVAEAMLRLNQINLYSLDSDSSKTLCVGDELTNVMEVDSRLKINRHKYYGYIVPGKDYFVALYNNVSYKAYFEGVGESQLQFFSWDGQPLLCVNLPYMVTSFFISENKYLYVFSNGGEEEVMYKYDCGDVLSAL